MAIFRCNKCGHLREVTNDYIGRSVNCPRCKHTSPIHETVGFVQNVIDRYMAQYKELHQLRQQITALESSQTSLSDFSPEELEHLQQQLVTLESSETDSNGQHPLADIDIYNTTAIASEQQYQPIVDWFQQHKIHVNVNHKALDTTGFFDEIAMQLGDNYDTLKFVSEKIKHIQQKGYTNVKLTLSKKNQKQIKTITQFCQELYDYSFLARSPYYQKDEKILRLTLCIECKSGEFRQQIKKYSTLRKRLKLEKTQFLLCVMGLSEEQTRGLSSMYDVTFVNEKNFLQHVEQLTA